MQRARIVFKATLAVAALCCLFAPGAPAATVRNYDLGEVTMPDESPKGRLPVRLWGAVGVPSGGGPHPLVIIGHGRHGDNCPDRDPDPYEVDFVWPCWNREQRNDLGLRHLVAALAARGVAAIAPDLNGAYTIGWGPSNDEQRWGRIVRRTLGELAREVADGGGRFGMRLKGRIDFDRKGILGHSRSGHHGVRFARSAQIRSLFLLAPLYRGEELPDLPTAVVAAGCDGDVPGEARRYMRDARSQDSRLRPVFLIKLRYANHNYFNRTLSRLRQDDTEFNPPNGADCAPEKRLRPRPQQAWIDRAAAAFFDLTLDGGPRPRWMRARFPAPRRLYGEDVVTDRLFP